MADFDANLAIADSGRLFGSGEALLDDVVAQCFMLRIAAGH